MKPAIRIVLALGLAAGAGAFVLYKAMPSTHAEISPAPEIGAAMPDFALKDTTGKEHKLSAYKGKVVVLNFCSQECPVSRGFDPAINALAKEFAEKDVVFLGVDSHKETTPEQIEEYRGKIGVPYAILKDTGNTYADAVGAKVTPELYIVDKEGKLAYHGTPDDRSGPEGTPTKHHAKDAITALTAGEPVATPIVKAWGCSIKRAS